MIRIWINTKDKPSSFLDFFMTEAEAIDIVNDNTSFSYEVLSVENEELPKFSMSFL